MVNLVCSGPGPHKPANGILGTGDTAVAGLRCTSPACDPALDPAVQAQQAQDANRTTMQQRAIAALAADVAFGNLATPTTAQAVAQVQRLNKQVIALIKLNMNQLDDTTGT